MERSYGSWREKRLTALEFTTQYLDHTRVALMGIFFTIGNSPCQATRRVDNVQISNIIPHLFRLSPGLFGFVKELGR